GRRAPLLVWAHGYLGLGAVLADAEARAPPPFRDLAVLGLHLLLILAVLSQGPASLLETLLQLLPDGIELGRHQRLGQGESVRLVESIENLPLELHACVHHVLTGDARSDELP